MIKYKKCIFIENVRRDYCGKLNDISPFQYNVCFGVITHIKKTRKFLIINILFFVISNFP